VVRTTSVYRSKADVWTPLAFTAQEIAPIGRPVTLPLAGATFSEQEQPGQDRVVPARRATHIDPVEALRRE
jgi:hypothetical protein